MARRPRVDSAAAAVEIVAAASRKITPPAGVKLRKCDQPHWQAIVADKPKSFWTDGKLSVAAQLARCMADIERCVDDGEGEPDAELAKIANALTNRQKTLRLMIDMTPASEGDKDERERRHEIAGQIEDAASGRASSLLN